MKTLIQIAKQGNCNNVWCHECHFNHSPKQPNGFCFIYQCMDINKVKHIATQSIREYKLKRILK